MRSRRATLMSRLDPCVAALHASSPPVNQPILYPAPDSKPFPELAGAEARRLGFGVAGSVHRNPSDVGVCSGVATLAAMAMHSRLQARAVLPKTRYRRNRAERSAKLNSVGIQDSRPTTCSVESRAASTENMGCHGLDQLSSGPVITSVPTPSPGGFRTLREPGPPLRVCLQDHSRPTLPRAQSRAHTARQVLRQETGSEDTARVRSASATRYDIGANARSFGEKGGTVAMAQLLRDTQTPHRDWWLDLCTFHPETRLMLNNDTDTDCDKNYHGHNGTPSQQSGHFSGGTVSGDTAGARVSLEQLEPARYVPKSLQFFQSLSSPTAPDESEVRQVLSARQWGRSPLCMEANRS
jgi:hypothetical protein